MTYRPSLGPGVARLLNLPACESPRIICDGCGDFYGVRAGRRCLPPKWFLDGKAPPKWKRTPLGSAERRDWCPRCH